MNFFDELKRRNVVRVGIAYIVASWLILQLTEVLTELMELESDIGKTVIILLIVGLIPALIFAWAYEMTPEGVKREKEVDRSQSITPKTGRKLDFIIIGMLAIGMGYFFWESRLADRLPDDTEASTVTQTESTDLALAPEPQAEVSRQSIAVLPFDNRSRLEDDEFFVEGMHDDLLTNLARIGSLKVISRTSVNQYKDTQKTIPQIALELGVATIMEGAVQRAGKNVRINVQLIDAKTDEHLWAEIFDRELTTDNLFAIQSEIAEAIADALEATLTDQEQEQITRRPTDNLAAYNAYLRGRQLLPKRTSATLEKALVEFERAVELDPQFALAWVGVAESAWLLNMYGTLSRSDTLLKMESAVNHALAIDPSLGEAWVSQASVHRMYDRFDEAETAYLRAIELSPNYATAYHWYFTMLGFSEKRLQEALVVAEKASQLDPLSSIIRKNQADINRQLGNFEHAEILYREVFELDPDFAEAYGSLSLMNSEKLGRFDEALKWNRISRRLDTGSMWKLYDEFLPLLTVGASALTDNVIEKMQDLDSQHESLIYAGIDKNIYKGNYAAASELASLLNLPDINSGSISDIGFIEAINGRYPKARQLMLQAYPGFTDPGQWQPLIERHATTACNVGWVLMQTGDDELGRELIRQATTHIEVEIPKYTTDPSHYSVHCHAALGDREAAMAALKRQVDNNQFQNWVWVRTWPATRVLLLEPGYAELKQRVDAELERQRIIIEAMYAQAGTGP